MAIVGPTVATLCVGLIGCNRVTVSRLECKVKHGDKAYSGFYVFVTMIVRTRRAKLCVNVDLRYTLYLRFELRQLLVLVYTRTR
jgi:hypothetical protein